MDDNKVIAVEQLPYIDLNKIIFKEIISTNSAYGVIWSGIYSNVVDINNHQIVKKTTSEYSQNSYVNNICVSNSSTVPNACAIKMIVLKSGSYYDKDNDKYINGDNIIPGINNKLLIIFFIIYI